MRSLLTTFSVTAPPCLLFFAVNLSLQPSCSVPCTTAVYTIINSTMTHAKQYRTPTVVVNTLLLTAVVVLYSAGNLFGLFLFGGEGASCTRFQYYSGCRVLITGNPSKYHPGPSLLLCNALSLVNKVFRVLFTSSSSPRRMLDFISLVYFPVHLIHPIRCRQPRGSHTTRQGRSLWLRFHSGAVMGPSVAPSHHCPRLPRNYSSILVEGHLGPRHSENVCFK